ncbi:ATP-binding cassette domain-containing protein, partial [Bradyrhizobium sp. Leo170]|uniref:ATP-binding cassette domain-containing protein n=1 Tax=Bradyrhizobium sp. Leo170 TaxID=1571199 RepID=UPI00102E3F62
MSAFLRVEHLSKHFGGVAALHDCSLSFAKGRVTGLIGPNGAGKTTLLNTITGLVNPDRGSVAFNGHDVTGLPMHRIASLGL